MFCSGVYMTINNCTIRNTQVFGGSYGAGGLFCDVYQSTVENCHQLGFSNDSSIIIVKGSADVGGLASRFS